jgi:hypothetical protein
VSQAIRLSYMAEIWLILNDEPAPHLPPRPGPFLPASVRHRSDGWTPPRQARFLGMLAPPGSVAAAARAVGLTRQTAYRLRQRPGAESFARAWDRALGRVTAPSRKVTPAEVLRRATEDLLWPVVHRGHFKHVAVKHDTKALLRLLDGIARKHGVSLTAVATRWVMDQPHVAGAIVGARYADHLGDTLAVFGLQLDAQDHALLAPLLAAHPGPEGDTYTLERDKTGRHGRIMKYNLNKS